jgi:hypothetical protein
VTIDGVGYRTKDGEKVYFLQGSAGDVTVPSTKRKNTSPLKQSLRQQPKRPMAFKPMFDDGTSTPLLKPQTPFPRRKQSFEETPGNTPRPEKLPGTPRVTRHNQPSKKGPADVRRPKVNSFAFKGRRIRDDFPSKPVRNIENLQETF